MQFYVYPLMQRPPLEGYICLSLNAPVLSAVDADKGLLLIDGTWRYAEQMERSLGASGLLESCFMRSLPRKLITAYPRRQEDCADQECGLASVEALYAAYKILGRPTDGLLDGYHWRELFLERNSAWT